MNREPFLEFEDYPSTDTPLSATNLNNMQLSIVDSIVDTVGDLTDLDTVDKSNVVNAINEVNDKNIMMIYLSDSYTMAATNVFYSISGFALGSSIGNKLTFSNNRIYIGAGVSKIKINYTAKIQSVNTTRTFIYLTMNGVNISQEGWWPGASGQQSTISFTPKLIDVNEGDYFSLACYGTQNTIILGKTGYFEPTYMTIEVIE